MDLCLQVAGDGDVRPMLAIYAPYVRDTAITFEYEVPTAAEFGARLHQVLPAAGRGETTWPRLSVWALP